jgi:hypothetical membrane protein
MFEQGNSKSEKTGEEAQEANRSGGTERILSLIAIGGVSYFGLVILLLSLFDTDYNPITLAASDYGVGRFAVEMNVGFFVAGIGILAFSIANVLQNARPKSKVGSAFLIVAGLVLIMDSYFTTNVAGSPSTLHGTIHGFGGFFFFISAPVGILLISRKIGRVRFLATLLGLVVGFVVLGAPDNASGLAERIVLLVIFSSIILASLDIYKNAAPQTVSTTASLPHPARSFSPRATGREQTTLLHRGPRGITGSKSGLFTLSGCWSTPSRALRSPFRLGRTGLP